MFPFSFPFVMTSYSLLTSINLNIYLYSNELFKLDRVVGGSRFSDLNLRVVLRRVFEAQCEAAVKLADLRWENARRRDGRKMSMGKFVLLLQKLTVGFKEMEILQVRWVLQVKIGMGFYFQKFEWMDQIFHCEVAENKLSFEYVKPRSFAQKILESHARKKYARILTMGRPH